jgi:hypothetical protein
MQVDSEALVAAQHWLVTQELLEDANRDWTLQSFAKRPGEELAPVLEPLESLVVTEEIVGSDEVIRCILSRGQAVSLDRRRQLLAVQACEGCATGSWPKPTEANSLSLQQGRFPTTCLAAILLSASYGHLPMYRNHSPARVARGERAHDTTRSNVDRRLND